MRDEQNSPQKEIITGSLINLVNTDPFNEKQIQKTLQPIEEDKGTLGEIVRDLVEKSRSDSGPAFEGNGFLVFTALLTAEAAGKPEIPIDPEEGILKNAATFSSAMWNFIKGFSLPEEDIKIHDKPLLASLSIKIAECLENGNQTTLEVLRSKVRKWIEEIEAQLTRQNGQVNPKGNYLLGLQKYLKTYLPEET